MMWAALLLCGHAGALQAQGTEASYVQTNTITQVVDQWLPDTHLYLLGRLPETNDAQLRQLAGWLKGKHWYVVLARSADGQAYTDIQGARHFGVEAMDYALGRGIGLKEGFEALTHPRTGEKDGAVFGLYLENRKLFLRTSAAQDRRGLSGEQHFAGDLDQWAKAAMRSAGPHGVVTAVKDTITHVSARLEDKIAREIEQSQAGVRQAGARFAELQGRAAAFQQTHPAQKGTLAGVDLVSLQAQLKSAQTAIEAKKFGSAATLAGSVKAHADSTLAALDSYERSHRQAQATLVTTSERLDDLAAKSQAFARAQPGATGDLSRIDIAGLNLEFKAAQAELEINPGRAQELAQQLDQRSAAMGEALARYPSAGRFLKEARTRLAALEQHAGADAVRGPLLEANQSLAAAQKAYHQGDSNYLVLIARASPALDSAEHAVSAAEAEAARAAAQAARNAAQRRFVFWLVILLSAGGLVATALLMHLSARRYRAQAKKLLADWRHALNEKLEVLQGDFDDNFNVWVAAKLGKCTGQTQRLVDQARESRGWVAIVWAMAGDRLKQVQGLVEPGLWGRAAGLFLAGNYQRALGFENEKVAFRPDDEELARELFGKERTWEDKLLGNLHDYAAFQASFAELVGQLNAHTQKVLSAVKEIEACALGLAPKLAAIETEAAGLEAKKAAVEQEATSGLFRVPSVFATLVPAMRATIAAARAKGQADPVDAYHSEAAIAERMVTDGQALADLVVKTGSAVRSEIAQATQALAAQRFETHWIEDELSRLSAEAEATGAAAATAAVAERVAGLGVGLASLGEKATRAQALGQEHARILERIARAHEEVAAARTEISQRTGVAPDRLLNEKGWKVDNKLYHARNRADEAAGLVGQGDLEGAQGKLEEAKKFGQQVSDVLEISLAAARDYRAAVAALAAQANEIAALVPPHRTILAQIRAGYAASVLTLGAGDAAHPNANGTIEDNIAETEDHLRQAADCLRNAETAFKEGRVLETADLLNQAKKHHEFALHRLGEIKEKQLRLQETEKANGVAVVVLGTKLLEQRQEIAEDARTMKPTLQALEKAARDVEAAAAATHLAQGDPFSARDQLEAAASALEHVHGNMARNDRDIFNLADSGLRAAERQMVPLTRLVRQATNDRVPDSKALLRAERETRQLQQQLTTAQLRLGERHGDWNALSAEANQIGAEAGRLVALVKGEMEKAEAAVTQISRAAKSVTEAGSWTGSHGVRILGSPGDDFLDRARALLAQGLYTEAQRQAESAYQTARKAIEDAEAAVAAETARLRRIEEARRQRAAEEAARLAATLSSSASSSHDHSSSWGIGGGSSGGGLSSSTGGSSNFGGFTSSGGGSSGW